MDEKIAVYICNNDYIWLTGISMISLVEQNKNIHVYVVGPDFTQESKDRLRQLAQAYGSMCTVVDLPERFLQETGKNLRWPVFAISRLFLADILPNTAQKVLYLDSDTLVMSNLDELWDYDMHGHIFCGVKDCISWRYKRNIGLKKDDDYINGGVLLVDLTELRKTNHSPAVRRFFSNHLYETSYFDQDVLNHLFRGEIGILAPKYNVMTVIAGMSYREMNTFRHPTNYYSTEEISYAKADPCIIHFTQQMFCWRPWIHGSKHPYLNVFWHYAGIYGIRRPIFQKQTGGLIRSILFGTVLNCPDVLRNSLLYIMGFLHSVWLPEVRHVKNRLYLLNRLIHKGET